MPGPQGQGQTGQPASRECCSEREGKKRREGNPERPSETEGKHPLVLHQLVAFCPLKSTLELLFFLLPSSSSSFRVSTWFLGEFMVSALDIKLKC